MAIELLSLFFIFPLRCITTGIDGIVSGGLSLSLHSFPAIVGTKLLLLILPILETVNILIFGFHSVIKILGSAHQQQI